MSRYFFDIFDGKDVIRDYEGQELNSLAAVRTEAVEAARELLEQTISRDALLDHRELRVRDAGGDVILVLVLRELLDDT